MAFGQFLTGESRHPRLVRAAPGADLGDDDQIVAIRVKRFADDLVGDMRTVEIAGVDMINPTCNGLAQHGERRIVILRRTEYAGTCQLHGAVAEPFDTAATESERAGLIDN